MVRCRLEQVVGRPVPVRAVVAVHGEGLRRRGKRVGGVTVVPADALCDRLRRGRRRLARRDVGLIVDAVSTFPPAVRR